MRTISIDIGSDGVIVISNKSIGILGEHNATMLDITIPETALIADCFVINFMTGNRTVLSSVITEETEEHGAWLEGRVIHCLLWEELTEHRYLSFTVDGLVYEEDGRLKELFKLPMVKNLNIEASVEGVDICSRVPKGILTQLYKITDFLKNQLDLKESVDANTAARHMHNNKTLLDKLGDIGGVLAYNGAKVASQDSRVDDILSLIPNQASEDNKLADKEFVEDTIDSEIKVLIPDEASSENQLADKAFVNDSISTNAAYFRGTFNSLAELQAYSGPVTNNDYAYVIVKDATDPNIIKSYQRYKYSVNQWLYEYEIGLHDLTPAQLAALDSGVTSEKIQAYDTVAVNTSGYGKIDGKPTFDGDRIKMEPKDVQLVPFHVELTFVTRTDFNDVAVYAGTDPALLVAELEDDKLLVVHQTENGMEIEYYDGATHYHRYSGNDQWYNPQGEPVSVTATGTIVGFSNDLENTDNLDIISPDLLLSYRSFCRIINTSVERMGEVLFEEDKLERLKWTSLTAYAEKNRNYLVNLEDLVLLLGDYLQIGFPNTAGYLDDAFVAFDIYKGETEVDLSFLTAKLYNGQPIDLTETGYYRVIATWNPQVNDWCLAYAKMEDAE